MTERWLESKYRTHTCGELTAEQVGQGVVLSGWIMRKRDHGGVVFVDLRDHYGVTQVVFSGVTADAAQKARPESVIQIKGQVVKREPSLVNSKLKTGEIEVQAQEFELLSLCDVLPFQVAEDDNAPEVMRLRSRFLDLRRDKLHANIVLRCRIIQAMRDIMQSMNFLEYQTPILTSSSPEGARDFIVPSRLHPGKFFALPQAPQQFKQLLMISGFDRYFQIAACFRDEDARADRTPGEFYQLDMELSFVGQEQVFAVNEKLATELFSRFSNRPCTSAPFPHIKYDESIAKYGTDKPDLRIPLEIADVSEVFAKTEYRVFRSCLDQGGSVQAVKVEVDKVPPRKFFDDLTEYYNKQTGMGMGYLVFEAESHKGPLAKFCSEEEIAALKQALDIKPCTLVFLSAGAGKPVLSAMGKLRLKLGQDLGKIDKDSWHWCWITDFPFYEQNEVTGQIEFGHNPFSMPQGGLDALNTRDPLSIKAFQYDLVCNGIEMGSGAIRNHLPEIMYRAFEIAGYPAATVDEKFGGMIRAFRFGAPPHGGFAHGLERIVMLLAGEENLREVIAFPMAQSAEDLLMGAPSHVSQKQLMDVHIELKLPEEKKPVEG